MGGVWGKNKKRKGKRWVKRGNECCDGVMSDVNYIYPSIMHPSPLQVCYDWSGGGAHLGQCISAPQYDTVRSFTFTPRGNLLLQPTMSSEFKQISCCSQQQLSQLQLSHLCNWRLYPFIYTNHRAEVPGCLFTS